MIKNRIKETRECKGISQLGLSYKTKIAPSNISAIETYKIHLYPGWLKRIAEALELPEDELLLSNKGGYFDGTNSTSYKF